MLDPKALDKVFRVFTYSSLREERKERGKDERKEGRQENQRKHIALFHPISFS